MKTTHYAVGNKIACETVFSRTTCPHCKEFVYCDVTRIKSRVTCKRCRNTKAWKGKT